jgi:hypothetical protein
MPTGRNAVRASGSARLGSARLGSARLGSARLGSARLGKIMLLLTDMSRTNLRQTQNNIRPKIRAARSAGGGKGIVG